VPDAGEHGGQVNRGCGRLPPIDPSVAPAHGNCGQI
jgi:hypothetical protein